MLWKTLGLQNLVSSYLRIVGVSFLHQERKTNCYTVSTLHVLGLYSSIKIENIVSLCFIVRNLDIFQMNTVLSKVGFGPFNLDRFFNEINLVTLQLI